MSNNNAEWGEETPAQTGAGAAEGLQHETGEPNVLAVVEALNAENSQLKDRVLRTLAEMEEISAGGRRTGSVRTAKTYGVTSFARGHADRGRQPFRARSSILPPEARARLDPSTSSLIEGVELTARDLEAALGRHGVKKLDPKGQKFDPNFHQAIFEAPDETVPSGTVSQVVQSGWSHRRSGPAAGDSWRLQGRPKGRAQSRNPRRAADSRRSRARFGHPPERQIDHTARPRATGSREPAMTRSTPWNARRPSPESDIASPEARRKERVGALR